MKYRLTIMMTILMLAFSAGTASLMGQENELDRKVEEIRKSLAKLPYYGVFDHLSFQYNEQTGKVVLIGAVTRPTLKSDAERVVERVEWVKDVENKIEVLPLSTADDRIRRALYRSIYGQPALQKYGVGANPSIHIIVKNGNVSLEGFVINSADRTIAEAQARSVGGTFAVKNNLQVDQGKETAKAE